MEKLRTVLYIYTGVFLPCAALMSMYVLPPKENSLHATFDLSTLVVSSLTFAAIYTRRNMWLGVCIALQICLAIVGIASFSILMDQGNGIERSCCDAIIAIALFLCAFILRRLHVIETELAYLATAVPYNEVYYSA